MKQAIARCNVIGVRSYEILCPLAHRLLPCTAYELIAARAREGTLQLVGWFISSSPQFYRNGYHEAAQQLTMAAGIQDLVDTNIYEDAKKVCKSRLRGWVSVHALPRCSCSA